MQTWSVVRGVGLILCVFLAVAFVVSMVSPFRYTIAATNPTWDYRLSNGALIVLQNGAPLAGIHDTVVIRGVLLGPSYQTKPSAAIVRLIVIPIWPAWIPLLVFALRTIISSWREIRLPSLGHCQTCGYNLTGNVSGRCPECGASI
ncbi:MAG: hypothetical protein MI923_29300 [Phycisphaerales bacterium]|nr:hypothetical protein [Phycisphaerales bacterium]